MGSGTLMPPFVGEVHVYRKDTLSHTAPAFRTQSRRVGYWNTIELDWHWHIEILPRLTKTAGFEWGSGFYINPTPPEDAARFLREVKL